MKTKLFLLSLVISLKLQPKKNILTALIGFLMINLSFGQVVLVPTPLTTNQDTMCAGSPITLYYKWQNQNSVPVTISGCCAIVCQGINLGANPSFTLTIPANTTLSTIDSVTGILPMSTSGSYHIFIVFSNNCSGTFGSSYLNALIYLKNPPTASTVTASGSAVLCPNSNLTLNSSSITGNIWNTTATTQSITVSSAGDYYVSNTNQCGTTNSNTLSITTVATPTIDVNSGAVCAGTNYTLAPTGANTYTYSSGSAVVTPTANTSYTVTGTDMNGCISAPAIANVTINALPSLTVTVLSPTVCTGTLDTLVVHGANTYTWSSGYIGQVYHPTLTATTHYTVTGTNINGCKNSDTATVTVYNCSTTGISNYGYDKQVNVYPNPATQSIYIQNLIGYTSIEIYNTVGLLVKSLSNSNSSIDITELEKGFYFIRIESETNNYLLKFIKE